MRIAPQVVLTREQRAKLARRYRGAGARRSATWPHAFHLTGTRAYGDCQDHTGKTCSCDPLEHSHYGHRGRYQRG
jgi:hypothetical protein